MKQLLSVSLIAVFAAYAYHHAQDAALAMTAVATKPVTVSSTPPTPTSSPNPSSSSALPATTTPPDAASGRPLTPASSGAIGMGSSSMIGQYHDGSYTGAVADAFYGNVQVRVTVSGGKITDVQFLQHPSDRQTSQMINNQAMPLLTQEAIQAQSAQVDGVSGASATSQAFMQSLGSALEQARTM